jgi:hypothetical protein
VLSAGRNRRPRGAQRGRCGRAVRNAVERRGDATVYPDSGTFKLYGPGFSHRGKLGDPVEYWEGEA